MSLSIAPSTTIEAVMTFDLSDVKRSYMKKHNMSQEQADIHERELKRYLALCIINPDGCFGMFSSIDELWHEFICHTHKYMGFCRTVAGRFIHHVPTSSDANQLSVRVGVESPRQQTIKAYEALFGPMDRTIWNMATEECDGCSGGDCCSVCTTDKKFDEMN